MVFSPINRLHSSKSEFTSKEPWHFDAVIEQSMIDFLQLRHQLIPYLYSANLITASEGRAIPVFAKAGAIIPLDKNPLKKEEIPSERKYFLEPMVSIFY